MKPETNKEKFNRLISDETSKWHQESDWREENESWLENSFKIALKVLSILRERHIPQKELAKKMAVSPQHINKILKGQENFTLETIFKLERALNISLIEIPSSTVTFEGKYEYANYFLDIENQEISVFNSSLLFDYDTFGASLYNKSSEEEIEKMAA